MANRLNVDYSSFRREFLASASHIPDFSHEQILHSVTGPQGDPLYTDIMASDLKPDRITIIVISGTHGTEGYFGSLCQSELCKYLGEKATDLSGFNFVLVHCLNPHGMSWYRRVNEHNVDLNRNCLDSFTETNPAFRSVINFVDNPNLLNITKTLLKFGFPQASQIIASGQYTYPDKIFFGGTEKQFSITILENLFNKLLMMKKPVYIFDLHTGLGVMGQQSLIYEGPETHGTIGKLQSQLGAKLVIPQSKTGFYKASGTLSNLTERAFSGQGYHITFEIGTKPLHQVLRTLIKTNNWYAKQKEFNLLLAEENLDRFFPSETSWQKKVVKDFIDRFIFFSKQLLR